MTPESNATERLANLVIGHGMVVLLIGLVAGVMLIFSLLDAVTLWPLPAWEVSVPGSTRGWQAAHVGGILNGVTVGRAICRGTGAWPWAARLSGKGIWRVRWLSSAVVSG